MTGAYIDAHFDEILARANAIEARLDDSGCTPERLKADNRYYAAGFRRAGERVVLIEANWEQTVQGLVSN